MQTRREYLIAAGLAKPGRGKFSRDGMAALEKARGQGVKFSDDDKPKPTASVPKEDKPDKPKPVGIVADIAYTFPEDEWKAVEKGTKRERSMREVCRNCGVSLVVHSCLTPSIVSTNATGVVAVTLVRRKG